MSGIEELLAEMKLRFTSGNAIQVHDARINIDEWKLILASLEPPECPSCKSGCGGLEPYYYCFCCERFIKDGGYMNSPDKRELK